MITIQKIIKFKIAYLNLAFIIFLFFAFAQTESYTDSSSKKSEDEKQPIIKITSRDSLQTINCLKTEIDKILNSKFLKKTKYGVAIYSINNEKYYYNKNIEQLLTPASTTKLFTTFNALNLLGPDFEIKTNVYTDGKISDGILQGNVYIVGRGDALLSIPDLEELADDLKAKGIKKIIGNIIADGTYFDTVSNRFIYSGDKDQVEPLQPITALCLNKNIATILIHSGNVAGKPVSVQIIPSSEAFRVINNATVENVKKEVPKTKIKSKKNINQKLKSTIKQKSKSKKPVKKQLIRHAKGTATIYFVQSNGQLYGDRATRKHRINRRKPSLTIGTKLQSDGIQTFIINGSLPQGKTYSYQYFIQNPVLVVAGAFKERLISGGIQVKGEIGKGSLNNQNDKSKPVLLAELRRHLTEIIYTLNKNSDNYLAETVFKIVGAFNGNNSNIASKSREKLFATLKNYGIICKDCIINDGCGLSRRNLVTPEAILSILNKAHKEKFGPQLDSALSIAGIDGTLTKRMTGTPAENNLRAKTGTLKNASALSGYVNTLDGELLAFSFMFNGNNVNSYKKIENSLGEILSKFSYSKQSQPNLKPEKSKK
jgi:D-alanyl-D-alanine carboxypeptidase/D-alanyl-D-alanine-endopeptidase (penicillin-binding protein 4)